MIRKKSPAIEFLMAMVTTALVAAICYPLSDAIGYQSVGLIFLMSIPVLSLFLGRSALIFAAILNFGVWNFFFIQPLYTFRVHSLHDLIALFTNLIVAIAASVLISRIRKSQVTTRKSREQLEIIHRFLGSLNDAISIKDVVKRTEEIMQEIFNAQIVIYLREKRGRGLAPRPFGSTPLHCEAVYQGASALFGSESANQHETRGKDIVREPDGTPNLSQLIRKAGNTIQSQILPPTTGPADALQPVMVRAADRQVEPGYDDDLQIRLYPLNSARKSIGIIGIRMSAEKPPEEEKLILLESFLSLCASAIDREMSIDKLKEKEIGEESEKLFQTVLNSVSHELKTPISIISAAVANLTDAKTSAEPEIRRQIGEELEIASVRLNHLVENILDMSRIESGLLRLNLEICDIADLMGIVHHELRTTGHDLRIHVDENIPFIHADINLLKQALINVIHNALTYTPENSRIFVGVRRTLPDGILISVEDEGPGIPEEFLPLLFDKFYRVPGSRSGGTGLGLTITRAILELHGGAITVRNRQSGGLEVSIRLKSGLQEAGPGTAVNGDAGEV